MHNLSIFLPVFSLSFCIHHLDREWLQIFVHGEEGYMFFFPLIYKNIMKHFIHPPDFCGEIFTKQKRKTWRIASFLSVNCVHSAYHFCESKKYWGTKNKPTKLLGLPLEMHV
jgi:hypothetical protein